jgi:hypothetical protein
VRLRRRKGKIGGGSAEHYACVTCGRDVPIGEEDEHDGHGMIYMPTSRRYEFPNGRRVYEDTHPSLFRALANAREGGK